MARRPVALLSITCDATAPDTIRVAFSTTVKAATAHDPAKYRVSVFTGPGARPQPVPLSGIASIQLDSNNNTKNAFITLDQRAPNPLTLTGGQWIQVEVDNVTGGPLFFAITQVRDVGDALGNIATSTGSTSRSIEDLAAFSLLTEEIGYPPSPLARPSGGGGAMVPAG